MCRGKELDAHEEDIILGRVNGPQQMKDEVQCVSTPQYC